MRLFFSLPLNPSTHQSLVNIINYLRTQPGANAIRWEQSARLHLTVRFLGSVAPEKVDELIAAVAAAIEQQQIKNFSLPLGALRLFPSERPKIIIMAVKLTVELAELFRAINEAVIALGFTEETRTFSPHITLGRLKGKIMPLPQNIPYDLPKILPVNELQLLQSHTLAEGSVYQILRRFPFDERFFSK